MDKEIRNKYYRVIGSLEAVETAAKNVACMPSDTATARLLDSARMLLNKAVLSAWEYAEQQTAEGKTEGTK